MKIENIIEENWRLKKTKFVMCSDMLGHWDGYKDEGAEQYNVNNGVLQKTIM